MSIILIFKKGDRSNIGNYRPINLMSNIYKLFSKIILKYITKKIGEKQPKEQAGFRSGFSTINHIHVIKKLVEKCQEYNHRVYMVLVERWNVGTSIYLESFKKPRKRKKDKTDKRYIL